MTASVMPAAVPRPAPHRPPRPTPHLCLLGDADSVHVQRWAREIAQRGWRVSVVTVRPAGAEVPAGPADFQQVVLPPVARLTDWLWRVGAARRALQSLAPDVVHAHYITSYGTLAASVAPALHLPLVMTAWGSDLLVTPQRHALWRALTGWTLRRADVVTGDSADLVEAIAGYRPRRPPQLVHWGVDLARFAPAPWAAKPRFDIASLRQWAPNYRIDRIVAALGVLRDGLGAEGTGAGAPHLHLLGGGPQHAALAAQVQALALQPHVTLHGRMDDAGMAAVLARCKVSVSVPVSDATSVSVLESMASGLAVVASDLPANRHWLGPDATLLLAAGGDALVPALAQALHGLWHDDARTQRLGAAHHARMQAEGSRAVQMDRMRALYDSLLGRCA